MAASDAKVIPIYGVAHREYVDIYDVTTGQLATTLGTISAQVSLNGAAFSGAGVTSAEAPANTGIVAVDIDATRMSNESVVIRVTCDGANTTDGVRILYPALYYLPATDPNNFAVLVQDGALYGQIDTDSGGVPLSPDGLRLLNPTDPLTLDDAQDLIMMSARYFTHGVAINRDTAQELLFGDDGVTPRFMADVSFNGTTETKGQFSPYQP